MTPIQPIPDDLKGDWAEAQIVSGKPWFFMQIQPSKVIRWLERIAKLTAINEDNAEIGLQAIRRLEEMVKINDELEAENTRLKAALTKPIETDEARRVGLPLECDDPDEVKAIERLYASRATRTPPQEGSR